MVIYYIALYPQPTKGVVAIGLKFTLKYETDSQPALLTPMSSLSL